MSKLLCLHFKNGPIHKNQFIKKKKKHKMEIPYNPLTQSIPKEKKQINNIHTC